MLNFLIKHFKWAKLDPIGREDVIWHCINGSLSSRPFNMTRSIWFSLLFSINSISPVPLFHSHVQLSWKQLFAVVYKIVFFLMSLDFWRWPTDPKKKRSFSKVAFLLEKSAGWWNGPNVTLRKKESQNCCPRRAIWAVWSSITQLSMKLHFGALFSEVEPLSLQTWLWTKKNGSPLQKRADFQNYSPREPFSFFSQWPSRRGFIF